MISDSDKSENSDNDIKFDTRLAADDPYNCCSTDVSLYRHFPTHVGIYEYCQLCLIGSL